MTKIFICGDPQGSFQHVIDAGLSERPESVIVLGDMELKAKLDEVLAPLHRLQILGIRPAQLVVTARRQKGIIVMAKRL